MAQKICHVTSAHPQEDGRIFRRACMTASRAGYDTYLVETGDTYDKDGVHIVGIGKPRSKGRLYRMTAYANKAYVTAKNIDADLYQLHDPELLPYAMRLKRQGKKVVFDSHENYVEQIRNKEYLPRIIARIASRLFDRYSSGIYRRIDGITYPGNTGEPSPFDGKCRLVVPTDNLPWLEELYDRYDPQTTKEKRTVCYIGAINEARGVTAIVEAAYDAECTLYLAGPFSSEDYRQGLMAKKEYECVKYLGVIGRDEVIQLLNRVEIGLCVLLDIGQYHKMKNFPTKVYEYMSMGLPVVMNASPYNDKMMGELQFGKCVDSSNRKEIADSIRTILDNSEMRETMGSNGRKAIKERFCWDIAQNELISMYRTILAEQAPKNRM